MGGYMEKIVITGYGIKAPGVNDRQDFKEILQSGSCTHGVLKGLGPINTDVTAGIINNDFLILKGKNYKRYPRVSRLAIAATDDAVEMSNISQHNPARISIIMGTSAGGLTDIEKYANSAGDIKKFPIHGVAIADIHTVSSSVAAHLGITGQVYTLTTGCTASSDAISLGKLLLETQQADVCIVGGADATLGQWSIFGFNKLGLVREESKMHETGVPFSEAHKGFVMSEGAGVLVLERETDALRREATIYGVVERIYTNNDGLGMFKSDLSGNRMEQALKDVTQNEVPSYVNSQAMGLKTNDTIEYKVHMKLFGKSVPITSIKGMIGHSFGAMGVMQVISSLISMEYGFIPPTIKTAGKGFEDLPIVFETMYRPVDKVAITTHGNGGNNTCLLIKKYSTMG
jgi:3-oxoacyl-(acyl-carrier-protein) synthase